MLEIVNTNKSKSKIEEVFEVYFISFQKFQRSAYSEPKLLTFYRSFLPTKVSSRHLCY